MSRVRVYEKPTCTTCRKMIALLREKGIDFDRIDYFIEEFTAAKLTKLLKKAGIRPIDAVRKADPAFKEHDVSEKMKDADLVKLMIANPGLIQRPIVEIGEKAVLARPVEKVLEIL